MLICPFCKSKNWKWVHKSLLHAARDEFVCLDCGRLFYRYEKTEYERPEDKKHEQGE